MLVGHQNNHVVTRIHDSAQIMRDQQHPAPEIVANLFDQPMEPVGSGEVDALVRLVEYQQLGPVHECSSEQQPLKLPSGQGRDRRIAQPLETNGGKGGVDLLGSKTTRQGHQTAHAEGQRGSEWQPLRNVAHPDGRGAVNVALADVDQPQDRLREGRLPGSIGAYEVDQFAAPHPEVHVSDDPSFAAANAYVTGVNQRAGR